MDQFRWGLKWIRFSFEQELLEHEMWVITIEGLETIAPIRKGIPFFANCIKMQSG